MQKDKNVHEQKLFCKYKISSIITANGDEWKQ